MPGLLAMTQTSAARNAASLQVGPAGDGFTAAVTTTNPKRMLLLHMRKAQGDKTSETLAANVGGKASGAPPVVVRLVNRHPAAIAGFVISVIVDAIEEHAVRRLAHIRQKVLEALPALADFDAAAAVVLEPLMRGVRAALFHLCPALVGRRAPASMDSDAGAQFFTMKTAAARRQPGGHRRHGDNLLDAAIAPNKPHSSMEFIHMREANDRQSTEALAGDILESGRGDLSRRLLCQEAARRFRGGPSCYFGIFREALQ